MCLYVGMFVCMYVCWYLPRIGANVSGGPLVRAVRSYPRVSSRKRARENTETYRIMAPEKGIPK